MYLEQINQAGDIKKLKGEELAALAQEIREFLIEKISNTGGHLASNLGVVELTMALHLTFNLPEDKIVWDVGHQAYTHKLLTGRREGFDTLRKYGGMSGFPKRKESDCDAFDTGHSSTSISAGLGLVRAREILGGDNYVISVIGDGSLTGGMAYEAMNNAAHVLEVIDATLDKLDGIEHADIIDKDGKDISLQNTNIAFRDVTFSYDKVPVLRNISFSIPQGSTTAIVGPSGSGKTTICNLIARFYDVDSGEVTVGGEDVRNMTCDSLLRNISMVFQKVYLFHDTIENNIRFGNPSATQEEIIEAAKKARCHDFIMALPDGYETVIGEGGSTLSGGEKQRISIARAILKNANIVILDEATASIDPENEHLIQQAISELTIGKTVIVIAHRLATIEHADQILVVDKGQVVQKGTHQELVHQEGLYRRFITIREQAEGWSIA